MTELLKRGSRTPDTLWSRRPRLSIYANPRVEREEHYYNAADQHLLDLGVRLRPLNETLIDSVIGVPVLGRPPGTIMHGYPRPVEREEPSSFLRNQCRGSLSSTKPGFLRQMEKVYERVLARV
jgi:hypothetical protein